MVSIYGTSSPSSVVSLLGVLRRGVVCGGDLEEMFALYREVFELQGMVTGPRYALDSAARPLMRSEDVPDDWMADYTTWAHEDRATEWLSKAAAGSVCLAARLPVGPNLRRVFARAGWSDCAITLMHGPLGSLMAMGCYRSSVPFTDDEATLMSLLYPYMGAALGTHAALRALAAPADERFDGALGRFEGHVFVNLPALAVVWSDRARRVWQELLGEPGSSTLWTRIEDVLKSVVTRFVANPLAARSVRVYRGLRAEIATVPPRSGEARRFVLLFVREAKSNGALQDPPLLRLLGDRQRAVALGAARGRSLKLIAAELGISLETARSHLRAAYRRLGVDSRVELRALLELDG